MDPTILMSMTLLALVGGAGHAGALHARALHAPPAQAMQLLRREVASRRTPAVQYRHFTADAVLAGYDYGLADVARRTPAGATTTFHGFSVTKTVTAVAILQLVERGLVELDAPAAMYLANMPYGRDITVRQLLAHSAGLPNPLPLRWTHPVATAAEFDDGGFFDDVLARYAVVKSPPNRKYSYSNLGYILLGRIIEQTTGLGYEAYVRANILEPIGLSTAELGFTLDRARHATGYHRRRSLSRLLLPLLMDTRTYMGPSQDGWDPFVPFYVNGAAFGGLVGTADGFTRYLQALLDPDGGLLSAESKKILFSANILDGGRPSGVSLSWHLGEVAGHHYAAHAGGGGGFYAEIRVYPELGRGSVLLFNRSGFSDARFLDRVDRALLPTR